MSANEKVLLAADNDRDMLEYLSEGYENQVYVCEQCGHEEPLHTYDLASDLRQYLAANPGEPAQQGQAAIVCDTCHNAGEVYAGTMTHHGYHQPPEPDMDTCPECSGEQRWYVARDIDRLVRQLDTLLNGDGAARQATLGDIVAQVAASQQGQGEPVAWRTKFSGEWTYAEKPHPFDEPGLHLSESALLDHWEPVYTHADPAEVERLRAEIERYATEHTEAVNVGMRYQDRCKALRAQLAEAHALLRHICGQPLLGAVLRIRIHELLSASAEPSAPNDCAICRDLGSQCMECEESEFREWADRHFAAADYRKTDAGVFIQDWMRHAYGAWCARGALASKP